MISDPSASDPVVAAQTPEAKLERAVSCKQKKKSSVTVARNGRAKSPGATDTGSLTPRMRLVADSALRCSIIGPSFRALPRVGGR